MGVIEGAPQYGNNNFLFRSGNDLHQESFERSSQVIGHFDEPQFISNPKDDEEEPRKIHKFISIHVAPPEEESQERSKKPIIKIPQIREKNYQIVFIKAPSPSSQFPEEIQLPPHPEIKTLVYVLLKKQMSVQDMVKIRGPPPTQKPSPPQVFFIRYKEGGGKNPFQNVGGGVNEEEENEDE
jgi:hypothetical protein